MEKFLKETYFIDKNNSIIQNVLGQNNISMNNKIDSEEKVKIAVKLFYWVRDKILYNPYSPFDKKEDYIASNIIKRSFGFCIQKAIVLCTLFRAVNIPCKLIFVDLKNYKAPEKLKKFFGDTYIYHSYCQIYLHNKWINVAPTFNIEMCEKFFYKPVEFDGFSDALFDKFNQNNELTFEYVNFRGEYDDFPFDLIIPEFKKFLGEKKFLVWKKLVEENKKKLQ